MKTARDNEFQAVLPVRGKILNTHKAGIDKIQKNAEIMTMMDAFGLEIDPKTMKVSYDKNKIWKRNKYKSGNVKMNNNKNKKITKTEEPITKEFKGKNNKKRI